MTTDLPMEAEEKEIMKGDEDGEAGADQDHGWKEGEIMNVHMIAESMIHMIVRTTGTEGKFFCFFVLIH